MKRQPAKNSDLAFETRAIHAAYSPHRHHGALNPPVHFSSTYAFESVEEGGRAFAGDSPHYIYSRLGTPTQSILEQRLASLEGAETALACASGMGAISSTLWSLVKPGDEIIADHTLYGCTFSLLQHGLKKFGVEVRYIDMQDPGQLARAISEKTAVVYGESPANPNMRLIDIAAVAKITAPHRAQLVIDNTYCTPYLQRPLELGADLVVHSATKYLGGHGDLIAGFVAGRSDTLETIRYYGLKDMTGAVISAMDIHLLLRGLKTLAVRMDRHCQNALAMAEFLESHPKVKRVHYPGLASFPQHDLASRQMRDTGGMLAFELRADRHRSARFVNSLELILCAVSLGDCETLIQHPASMTHSTYSEEELAEHLISPNLLRLSAGLENIDDILADLKQALDRL